MVMCSLRNPVTYAKDLDLKDGTGVALISDGHKGIIQVVKRVVPNVEHRLCARHIYANFCKKYGGVVFRNLFWAASKTTNHDKWVHIMGQLKEVNEEAHQYLMEREPKLWCRSFFKVGVDCDAVENGLSESFNSHIRIARRKPILGLFEDIRCYVMQRNATLRKECEKWEDDMCPNIRKVLELHKRIQRKWSLIPSGWMQFEVRQGNGLDAFNVQLDNKTCSCRQWQLTGIPCPHSITAMYNVNMNPDDFVTDSFRLATYKKLYEFNIKPVKGIDQWRKIKHIPCLPPKERRMPGRPSIARKKDKSELRKHEDGVDLQHDGVELQEDEVDLQHDGAELQDDGHNIQPAVAPARVRTRRQSQRLVMRNWNRRPMPTVNGEGTTPEKAFLIL
ncbi:hypothetical protein Tco_0658977 [Tanacetum coccineum]